MAFIRASQGGGGEITPTMRLWNNPDTEAIYTGGLAGLEDDISNYKYLRFRYISSLTTNIIMSIIVSVEDFRKCKGEAASYTASCSIRFGYTGGTTSAPIAYVRGCTYVNDTRVNFTDALRVNGSGSASAACIPLDIYGLN